jgi:hypothetical protein
VVVVVVVNTFNFAKKKRPKYFYLERLTQFYGIATFAHKPKRSIF